jgi:hypothetical protein
METAFDLKALVAKLSSRGLDLAEESAKIVIAETLDWVQESVVLSPNKFDDVAAAFIPQVKAAALELADKIDGQVG